jgi:hypothetical protein
MTDRIKTDLVDKGGRWMLELQEPHMRQVLASGVDVGREDIMAVLEPYMGTLRALSRGACGMTPEEQGRLDELLDALAPYDQYRP